jgi:tRNA pseudouridine38-40 synthase
MSRFFIEVAYKGTNYAGFQIQKNANSIQAEIQKALKIFFKEDIELTCSSRTDSGVHADSNFFHFDSDSGLNAITHDKLDISSYNINAILPDDIVVKRIFAVKDDFHSRFDAISREYQYNIYTQKDPFLADRAYYYPYKLNIDEMNKAAALLLKYTDFMCFSKKNTQVKTFNCTIIESIWTFENSRYVYTVKANRFLRGMVRALVATMLRVGTGKLSLQEFIEIIEKKDATKADFSAPPQGLFLKKVNFI